LINQDMLCDLSQPMAERFVMDFEPERLEAFLHGAIDGLQ